MKLIIVESPKKTTSISKILGSGHIVLGCGGHFMELKDGKNGFYGVDIANNFKPTFQPDPAKAKFISKIRDAVKTYNIKPDDIYIATDDDREGEAIAWHLANYLNLNTAATKRMCFHSITAPEVTKAMANPSRINQDRVDSALARQITDKVVGYEISPILWRQIGRGLSAGRVQSVVTRIVVDLEKDILNFKSKTFFTIDGTFALPMASLTTPSSTDPAFPLSPGVTVVAANKKPLIIPKKLSDDTQDSEKIDNSLCRLSAIYSLKPEGYDVAKNHLESLSSIDPSTFVISSITSSKSQRNPPAPFVTSSLQQESSNRFGWTPKTTMSIAQSLYEKGLITYMRTDSSLLSQEAFDLCKVIIETEWTSAFYQGKQYGTVAKGSQEAHEAIRPTNLQTRTLDASVRESGSTSGSTATPQEVKLYDLIWKRTIASQMKPEEVLTTTYIISPPLNNLNNSNDTIKLGFFTHKRQQTTFLGFKILYQPAKTDDDDENDQNTVFPYHLLKQGMNMRGYEIKGTENMTEAGGRYTEASLIKKMEKDGIGRPSTWASMIDKIQEKGYVEKKTIPGMVWPLRLMVLNYGVVNDKGSNTSKISEQIVNKKTKTETNKLVPTDLGKIVTNFLEREFTEIMDYKFTADMEAQLDLVLKGNKVWQDLVRSYWDLLNPKLTVLKQASGVHPPLSASDPSTSSNPSTSYNSSTSLDASAKGKSIVTERTKNERYLGLYPGTNQKIYATIARYGACIRREPADLIIPTITLKPKDKPVITIVHKNPTLTATSGDRPIASTSAITTPTTNIKPVLKPKTPKKNPLRAPQFWSLDKNKGQTLESITLEEAIKIIDDDKIFKNGKSLGSGPDGEMLLKKGRFGSYLEYNKKTKSIKEEEVEGMTLEKAISLFTINSSGSASSSGLKRHIEGVGDLVSGRYGSYFKLASGKNVNLRQLKVSEEALMLMSDADIKALVAAIPDSPNTRVSKKTFIPRKTPEPKKVIKIVKK